LGPLTWRGTTRSESEARWFSPSKPPPFLGHGLGVPPKNPNCLQMFFFVNVRFDRFRERFFFLAKKYQAMEGGLATRRFATQIFDPKKNPWMDFF
ncbi:MAG: hypothetical protein J6Y30_13945, partial [Treponema sp.]|nr:hypothetical protein [Treponema sp.]